jgi:hypothetical protein
MKKVYKGVLVASSLTLIGFIGWNALKPKMYTKVYSVQPKAIVAEVSPTNGIKVVIEDDMDWTPVFQILVILLGTYGGIKAINKYIK